MHKSLRVHPLSLSTYFWPDYHFLFTLTF